MAKARPSKSTRTQSLKALRVWVASPKGRDVLARVARESSSEGERLAEVVRVSTDKMRARVTL